MSLILVVPEAITFLMKNSYNHFAGPRFYRFLEVITTFLISELTEQQIVIFLVHSNAFTMFIYEFGICLHTIIGKDA